MAASKAIKRIFISLFVILALLIVAAIAIPYFFKDKLIQQVKNEINNNVEAKVDFEDVSLSLFRSFPDFTLSLQKFDVQGINDFEGVKLASADEFTLSFDLMSVIKNEKPMRINTIFLDKPDINIISLQDGKSNYEIYDMGPTTEETTTEPTSFAIELQEYEIRDGHLKYVDKKGNIFTEIIDLDHKGTGDFTQDIVELNTQTNIESMTLDYDGIRYFNKVKGDFDVDLLCDLPAGKFTIKDNKFKLNAMELHADGYVQNEWEKVLVDIKFDAPQNKFKNLLSLIPNAYTKGYNDVKANGDFALNGYVKGDYNLTTGALPAYKVDLSIDNADFKYPDLPMGVSDIETKVIVNSPSSNPDAMTVDIPVFKMNLGNNPFEAMLKLKTPVSDPDVDTKVKGNINLADIAKAFPMEGVSELNGLIDVDMMAKATMSALDKKDYEAVDMSGNLKIQDMIYIAEGLPKINIKKMNMDFSPQTVKVLEFISKMGQSDITASGNIDNILAYFSPAKTMTGSFVMTSDFFNADEWIPAPTDETVAEVTPEAEPVKVFDRFDFDMNAKIKKLKYDIYDLEDMSLVGNITSNKADIKDFRMMIGNSDLKGKGNLTNIFNYVFENETLYGDLSLVSNYLDLNQFMIPVEGDAAAVGTAGEELEPFLVPEKMDIDVKANIGKMTYTNITMNDVVGDMKVKDQTASIENASMKTLGGRVGIDGSYETKNPEKPNFDLSYKVASLDFQQAFDKLNTFQALAPIGKFLQGQFNTKMSFKGTLGKDLMPNLSDLTADGIITTVDAMLANFKPLEKINSLLNINTFDKVRLKNTKNWFEIKDGMVILQEFDQNVKGVDMVVGGSHGLNQDMDYNIVAKIPRKMLDNNAAGAAANKGFALLNKKAGEVGLNIGDAEFINVDINIGGNLLDPKVNIKPIGTGGQSLKDQAHNIIEEKKQAVEAEVNKKVDEAKDKVNDTGEQLKEEGKKKAKQTLDTLISDPTNAKDKIKDVLKDDKPLDSIKTDVKDVKESAKEGVKKLKNIFGKKKNE